MNYSVPTPHNGAKAGEIAENVIMSGDPLRAKFIAENWLADVKEYNQVRGMLGYTGTYNGMPVSVQGHGMGIPSIGIYTYELFRHYNVQRIIRVGSSGGVSSQVKLGDMVIAMNVCTDSAYMNQYGLPGSYLPGCSYELLSLMIKTAKDEQQVHVGTVLSSDLFYNETMDALAKWREMGVLSVEMESLGLYMNAVRAQRQALCITTVSDLPFTGEGLSAGKRQQGFSEMIELALETLKKSDGYEG